MRIAGAIKVTEWLLIGICVQECFTPRFESWWRCSDHR